MTVETVTLEQFEIALRALRSRIQDLKFLGMDAAGTLYFLVSGTERIQRLVFTPTTIPVTGPLTDAELRASPVPVSGSLGRTWTITETVPISAASLPLPAGASTSALQLPAGHTVDVTDRAARFLGLVMEQRASNLGVTAVGLVNAAVTATLPAPGVGLFHYITHIKLTKGYSVVGVAAGAGVTITSTNLPGNPAWSTEQSASPAGTRVQVIWEEPTTPIRSTAANTATTFVAPAQLETIWRWNIRYFTA